MPLGILLLAVLLAPFVWYTWPSYLRDRSIRKDIRAFRRRKDFDLSELDQSRHS